MMQLLCNNTRLDLYDNAGLQFKHDNPLFAFDNLSCERTTQFKIPSTPTNDKVFSLARIPAYSGEGMRRKFSAQLQSGVVVKNGYLYISSFDGKDYTAIFVTGEFVGLQAIRNLGKLSALVSLDDYVQASTYGSTPSANVCTLWANVSYRKENNSDILHPSIELESLYNAICSAQGIQSAQMPAAAAKVRIVAGELKGLDASGIEFQGSARGMAEDTESFPLCYSIYLDKYSEFFTKETAQVMRQIGDRTPYIYYSGSVEQYVAKQDLEIEFPNDWDDDYFIGYFINGGTWFQEEFQFLGGRSFTANYGSSTSYSVSGESLRGRKVAIPKDSKFVFISKYDYMYEGSSSGTEQGWGFQSISCDFGMKSEVSQTGAIIRLQDNLPDMTFVELLKTIAALSGCVLNYSDADGIMFETLDVSNYQKSVLSDILKRGEVQRTFSDYAQHNLIVFDGDYHNLSIDYTIDNDNLKEENELQKLPFSEGESYAGSLYVRTDEEKQTLGANNGGSYLEQVSLPRNAGLQSLCTKSTQFKMNARLNLMEYTSITPKTILQVDGQQYVWTSRAWQGDTADFTLAKI